MSGSIENSQIASGLVIEVIGPLLDDRGTMARTYQDLLATEQVVLRPGAVAQVAGAAIEWTLQTLLEGHGRFDLAGQLPVLRQRVSREWEGLTKAGLLRAARFADEAWPRIKASGLPVLLLFGGDPALVPELLASGGLSAAPTVQVGGGGSNGLPRPDAVKAWLETMGLEANAVRAAVRSPAAALAAAGARLQSVTLIGEPVAESGMLPVDATATDLAAFLERSTING